MMTTALEHPANPVPNPGYFLSPWPGEDGGPQRLATVRGLTTPFGTEDATEHPLTVTSRMVLGATMCVLRDPGEVYLLASSLGGTDTTSMVERIDPITLNTIEASPTLPGGLFWPGGLACHANGSLYVTYGRWCHRLAPDCSLISSIELPRDRPYNSLVILPDGTLVMKDIGSRMENDGRLLHLPDSVGGSELVFLDPEDLTILHRTELPEGSVARLSVDHFGRIVAVGDTRVWFVDPNQEHPESEPISSSTYLQYEGQTYGWDPVVTPDAVWFLDNGAGSEDMAGTGNFVGLHTDDPNASPLHLVQLSVPGQSPAANAAWPPNFRNVCGRPGGVIANPPLIDVDRDIVVGFDSGHCTLAAWRISEGVGSNPMWSHSQAHGSHLLLWAAEGVLVSGHFDVATGVDSVVFRDIETGAELDRATTGSPVQSVLFPCPGWHQDVYTVSFTGVTRIARQRG